MATAKGASTGRRYGAPFVVEAAARKADARRLFNAADWRNDFVLAVYRDMYGALKAQKMTARVTETVDGREGVEEWIRRLREDWLLPEPVERLINDWQRKGMRSPLTVRVTPAVLAGR